MILHHQHQWMFVIVARSVSLSFSSLLRSVLHTKLVKNVIIFRFDQSYEQPMSMMLMIRSMYIKAYDRQTDSS